MGASGSADGSAKRTLRQPLHGHHRHIVFLRGISGVGADLGFTPGGMGATSNHVTEDYQVMDYDQKKADGKNRAYTLAHSLAKTYAEERGIHIYNAGIGGHLEVYERVNFASLFGR